MTGQLRDDPIMRGVDLGRCRSPRRSAIERPEWATRLVESDGRPLLLAGETGGRKVAVLDFRASAAPICR